MRLVTRRTAPEGERRQRTRRRLRDRLWVRITAGVMAVFLLVVSWSVVHALTIPGEGSVSARLAEWARDHYLGPVVTFGEWLTYSPPKKGGKPSFALTGPTAAAVPKPTAGLQKSLAAAYGPPPPLKTFARKPLPGEGKWRVLGTVDGEPAIYGTYLRASSVYTSYVAGIVSMNQDLLRFELRPGTEDPGPGNWKAQPYIPPGTRRGLEATFNGGFKIDTSGGGFYLNGGRSGTLTTGVASVVYYRNGHIAIGVWGHGLRLTPDVVGVRQNLHLIVSHGRVPASVNYNVEGAWGATLGGGYYVWRSGIGITRGGRVIFVYGPALDVQELAKLLQRAGAVTALQLDINPDWMSFMYYLPKHHPKDPVPVNLLPGQVQPPDRYYYPASRDFTAVYAR
jgi:Phosphodiester glycosidase